MDMRYHMLNEREYAYGSGKKIRVSDWPIVQAGDLKNNSSGRTASPHVAHGTSEAISGIESKGVCARHHTASPIPQPAAEVVQPPAPPIPDLPSPYLASLVAKMQLTKSFWIM